MKSKAFKIENGNKYFSKLKSSLVYIIDVIRKSCCLLTIFKIIYNLFKFIKLLSV